jgi:hypothetical protein
VAALSFPRGVGAAALGGPDAAGGVSSFPVRRVGPGIQKKGDVQMFERSRLTPEVKKAIERAQAVLNERQRIREAIAKAERTLPAAETALHGALEELSIAEADAALSGETKSTRSAQTAVADARGQIEAINARIAGLKKRLATTDDGLLGAAQELETARNDFTRHALDEFRREFVKAAERFAEILRVGRGLSEGLGLPLHLIKLVDPENSSRVLVPLFEVRRQEGIGWVDQWIENPTARSAFESVRTPKDLAEAIARETKQIRTHHEKALADETRRRWEAEPPRSTGLTYPPEVVEQQPEVPRVEVRGARMFPDNPERAAEVPQFADMRPAE